MPKASASAVAVGDIDDDGDEDLHFTDYDTTQTGFPEAPNDDLNDRLLINDGNGFFTDLSAAILSAQQLQSALDVDRPPGHLEIEIEGAPILAHQHERGGPARLVPDEQRRRNPALQAAHGAGPVDFSRGGSHHPEVWN